MKTKALWQTAAICLITITAFLTSGCDRPLRFPFQIYPTPEPAEGTDSVPPPPTSEIIPNAVTDYDGNVYDAVRIGNQIWLRQNMRTTHYADGTPIPNGIETPPEKPEWAWYEKNHSGIHNSDSLAYYYEIPNADKEFYGLLYNWSAAVRGNLGKTNYAGDVQGVCPDGWHVPSDEEWSELERYVCGVPDYTCSDDSSYIASSLAADTGWGSSKGRHSDPGNAAYLLGATKGLKKKGKKVEEVKERADYRTFTPDWKPEDNNATGFSAVPAGRFTSGFTEMGKEANFWTASRSHDIYVWYRYLNAGSPVVYKTYNTRDYGFSVRCLRD